MSLFRRLLMPANYLALCAVAAMIFQVPVPDWGPPSDIAALFALYFVAAAGWIKLSAASIAKLALGIASHPGPDGKPSVDTPLTIQNRHVSAGAIKLGQVPELKLN